MCVCVVTDASLKKKASSSIPQIAPVTAQVTPQTMFILARPVIYMKNKITVLYLNIASVPSHFAYQTTYFVREKTRVTN